MAVVQQANTWLPLQGKVAMFEFGIFGGYFNYRVTLKNFRSHKTRFCLSFLYLLKKDGNELLVRPLKCMIMLITSRLILTFHRDSLLVYLNQGNKSLFSSRSGSRSVTCQGYLGWVFRDPYRPMLDMQISRACITSIDWLAAPRYNTGGCQHKCI